MFPIASISSRHLIQVRTTTMVRAERKRCTFRELGAATLQKQTHQKQLQQFLRYKYSIWVIWLVFAIN